MFVGLVWLTSNNMFGLGNFWDKSPSLYSGNFKISENHEGDLSQKSPKPNMQLLVNHTKPTNTLYWNFVLQICERTITKERTITEKPG